MYKFKGSRTLESTLAFMSVSQPVEDPFKIYKVE